MVKINSKIQTEQKMWEMGKWLQVTGYKWEIPCTLKPATCNLNCFLPLYLRNEIPGGFI